MKAGNVTGSADISLIVADSSGAQASLSRTGDRKSFSEIMGGKTTQSLIPDFGSSKNVPSKSSKYESDSKYGNDVSRIISDSRKKTGAANDKRMQKMSGKTEVSKDSDITISKTEDFLEGIVTTVAEELGIDRDDLELLMDQLGMKACDLLKPQNLAALVAKAENVDVMAILTDSLLGAKLSVLTDSVSQAMADFTSDTGISCEELLSFDEDGKTHNGEEIESGSDDRNDMTQENVEPDGYSDYQSEVTVSGDGKDRQSQVAVSVVRDEASGKEIRVTVEQDTGETSDVRTVGDLTKQQEASGQADSENDSHNKNRHGTEHMAQNIVRELTQAVTGSTVESSYTGSTVNSTDVFNQILDAVKVNVTSDTTSMELQLTPEHLGKISLTVAATKDGVLTASIVTQNEAVKAAVENQLIELKEALNNQGLKIQDVHVAVASQGFDINDGTQDRNDGSQKKQPGRRRFRDDASLLPETDGTDDGLMELSGSSVSYKA